MGDPPNYEPDATTRLDVRAEATGRSAAELALDTLLERDGRGIFIAGESRVDGLASFVLEGEAFFLQVLVGHGER